MREYLKELHRRFYGVVLIHGYRGEVSIGLWRSNRRIGGGVAA
jgi:hypothetical protein